MRTHLSLGATAVALIALTACVPMRFSGYQASGNGKQEISYCIGWIQDRLRIEALHGVELIVDAASPSYGSPLAVRVEMEIPIGTTVSWLERGVTYLSLEWPAPRKGEITMIQSGAGLRYEPLDAIPGTKTGQFFDPGPSHFVFFSDPDGKSLIGDSNKPIQRFSIELPPLSINGDRFTAGAIDFKAYRRWGQYYCLQ